ncbi:MAG: hypothetical protein Q7R52_02520 [archaeon]|nr:hypothetical protein [archaeon]
MFVKKLGDCYYVCLKRRKTESVDRGRFDFLVSHQSNSESGMFCGGIYTPKELIGKWVRLKVEIIEKP